MKCFVTLLLALLLVPAVIEPASAQGHPDTSGEDWTNLFRRNLSNALYPEGVWTVDEERVLTASEDQAIWSSKVYDSFVLDLEFRNAPGTNSGVIIYATDLINWIPNSVEIQIADDYSEEWGNAAGTWQAGAIFGHLAPGKRTVKRPGEWNRMTITAQDHDLSVVLNGELITQMDMRQWTSATTNPDGSEIPEWLSTPFADLPTYGHIGLQGKHAGAPIWFRNIRIREIR